MPLARNHAQLPKTLKVSVKMAVPIRKTLKPTMLNLIKRAIHLSALSAKPCLTDLLTLITLKNSIILRAIAIFKQSTIFFDKESLNYANN